MCSQSLQCSFRDCVHSERRGKTLYIKDIGGLWVLGSSAGPQQPLRTSTEVVNASPARRTENIACCFVSTLRDRDAELVVYFIRCFARHSRIPAANENRRYRTNVRVQTGFDTTLNASQESFCRCDILFAREQESDIDGYAGKDCLLDCWNTF